MSRRARTKLRDRSVGESGRKVPARPGRHWSDKAIVVTVALKIAGIVLIFDTSSAVPFDGPKTTFSLATAGVLVGLLSLALLRRGWDSIGRSAVHIAVLAVVLSTVVASLFAQDRYIALVGADRRLGLTFTLDMAILFAAVAVGFKSARDWVTLAAAAGSAGLATMGYGFVEYLGLDPIPWVDDVRTRPPSTFGNADKFGHFLGASFAVGASVAALPLGLSRRARICGALYAVVAVAAALLIATRGTLLGVVAGLCVIAAGYVRLVRPKMDRRTLLAGSAVLVALTIAGAGMVTLTPLGARLRSGVADTGVQQRVFMAEAVAGIVRDRPLIGYGPDHFGIVYPLYRPERSVGTGLLVNQNSAHNWLLQAAATTGLVGALCLAALAVTTTVTLWRRLPGSPAIAAPVLAGAAAYWAQGLVTIGSVSVDWMGWVAAGAAASLGGAVTQARVRRSAAAVQFALLGAGLAFALAVYPAFQANRELKTARALAELRPERAIPAAERAVALDPGRAEHWYALGRARQERQMWRLAAESFQQATDRAPHVSEYWSSRALSLANLSRSGDQSMGGAQAALGAARRGAEVNPYYSVPRHVLAVVALSLGEYSQALEAASEAIRLFREDPLYYTTAAESAVALPDPLAARSALRRLVTDTDVAVLRIALARISLKLGDSEVARSDVRRALALEPSNVAALELARQLGVAAP